MHSRFSKTMLSILILSAFLGLAALACNFSIPDLQIMNSSSKETSLVAGVHATLTSIIETEAAMATPTPPPTSTSPPTPTPTITPTPTETQIPTETFTPTPTGPWIGPITFATGEDDNGNPVNPGDAFKVGIKRAYAFMKYGGLKAGMKVGFYWYVNGKKWVDSVAIWDRGAAGTYVRYVYYVENKSLDAGKWELKIFIDGDLAQSETFEIVK